MAERLGRALQKLVQRFESARYLHTKNPAGRLRDFFFETGNKLRDLIVVYKTVTAKLEEIVLF